LADGGGGMSRTDQGTAEIRDALWATNMLGAAVLSSWCDSAVQSVRHRLDNDPFSGTDWFGQRISYTCLLACLLDRTLQLDIVAMCIQAGVCVQ
jgi:hypothetical protein